MMMRSVGRSGLLVSAVGLGTNNFGFRPGIDVDSILGQAIDAGVTLIDTADVYGDGESERLLGQALANGRRARVILATKWGIPPGLPPGEHEPPYPLRRGSRDFIIKALDASLKRLGTDYVDLYQMHFPDPDTPIEETLATLSDLIKAGKLRYVGVSNISAARLVEANVTAHHRGWQPFVSVQSEYSLLRREVVEPELAAMADRHGTGLFAYFPLASGLLSGKHIAEGKYAPGSRFADIPAFVQRFGSERNWEIVRGLTTFAAARGHSLLELAIAWLLARKPVASVIIGATSPAQVAANAAATTSWMLTVDEMTAVDAITGVPAGTPAY